MLIFHYDNDNEYENDNETSLSFSLGFCTQRDERLIASISSSTTTVTNRNPGITQEMNMSAHKNFVLVLVVVVKSTSLVINEDAFLFDLNTTGLIALSHSKI